MWKNLNHKLWYVFMLFIFCSWYWSTYISFDTKNIPLLSEYTLTVTVVYTSMIVFIDLLNEYFGGVKRLSLLFPFKLYIIFHIILFTSEIIIIFNRKDNKCKDNKSILHTKKCW